METRLEKFNFLIDILDKWKVNTAERVKNAGSFIFLTENSYVHHIVVSPNYRTTMPGLKTFFAMDVLEIYCSNSKSKASYTDIQAYLSDEKAKKYGFAFNLFDGCFDRELNRNAFLKDSFIMSRKKNLIRMFI